MPIIKCRKEKLTQVAIELYSKRGYNNTSIGDLAGELGIKKSSIYHHYDSKEDILWYALNYICQYEDNFIFLNLTLGESSLYNQVHGFLNAAEHYCLKEIYTSSFVATLSHEINNLGVKYSDLVKKYFDKWIQAFEIILSLRKSQAHSPTLAIDCCQKLIGAIVLQRIYADNRFVKDIFSQIKQLII